MNYVLKDLKVEDIKPDKNQPRKTFDDEALQQIPEEKQLEELKTIKNEVI